MLVVEFIERTRIHREPESTATLPILRNGPPGTFVVFEDGSRVSLPTDQIVDADDSSGRARVAFGGMRYAGIEDGFLVFHRERDLRPADELSPQRGVRMTLAPSMIHTITAGDRLVWPHG